MEKTIEIPDGYEARIEGNKVILEPKDERVRKEIISFIKEFEKDHYRCIDFSPWIAYLEKQQEQKPTLDDYLKATPAERRKMSMTGILEKEQKPIISAEESLGISQGEYNKIVDECIFGEHKEQKPTLSKSEIDFADTYSKGVWEKLMSQFKNTEGYHIGCNDVSDIVLNAILDAFKWAKSHQNATEWSEEDEENFKWFEKFFRAESIVAGGREIPQDRYLWFKSLRPKSHWKPIEEQMEALKIACTIREGERNYYLHTLLDDLEKL